MAAFRLVSHLMSIRRAIPSIESGGVADLNWCLECGRRSQMKIRVPIYGASLFCSPACMTAAELRGPLLIRIPRLHHQYVAGRFSSLLPYNDPLKPYITVSNLFTTSWHHPTKPPGVLHVYAIIGNHRIMNAYRDYVDSVRSKIRHWIGTGLSVNERQLFHGTKRACRLGDDGTANLCLSMSCSLCQIIQNSFDVRRFRSNTSWGR